MHYLVSAPFSSSSNVLKAPMRGEALSELGRDEYCNRIFLELCSMEAAWHSKQAYVVEDNGSTMNADCACKCGGKSLLATTIYRH